MRVGDEKLRKYHISGYIIADRLNVDNKHFVNS